MKLRQYIIIIILAVIAQIIATHLYEKYKESKEKV